MDNATNEYQRNERSQREQRSSSIKKNTVKTKTDYMSGVIITQMIVFLIIGLIFFGFYKAQSKTFVELRNVYHSIMQRDMTFSELSQAVKTAVNFISEPKTVSESANSDAEAENNTQIAEEQTAIDELLTGAGGEDILCTKENASFAPFYLSVPIVKPVNSNRITSYFGYRINPVTNEYGFHSGLDMAAPEGTDIKAAFDGVVEKASYSSGRGNYLIISSSGNIRTVYCHCSEVIAAEGANVRAGEVVAKVGSTGQATGPHLHFEIIINGVYHNPIWVLNFE